MRSSSSRLPVLARIQLLELLEHHQTHHICQYIAHLHKQQHRQPSDTFRPPQEHRRNKVAAHQAPRNYPQWYIPLLHSLQPHPEPHQTNTPSSLSASSPPPRPQTALPPSSARLPPQASTTPSATTSTSQRPLPKRPARPPQPPHTLSKRACQPGSSSKTT